MFPWPTVVPVALAGALAARLCASEPVPPALGREAGDASSGDCLLPHLQLMQSNWELTQPPSAVAGAAAERIPWFQQPASSLFGIGAARVVTESFTGELAVVFAVAVLLFGMLALYYFEEVPDQRSSHRRLFEAKAEELAVSSRSLPPEKQQEKLGAPHGSHSRGTSPKAAVPAAQEGPPPICPRLILPSTTARFLVATSSLVNTGETLELKGATGRTLLRATVDATDGKVRSLALASLTEEEPLCTVTADGAAEGTLDILGRCQRRYGVIVIHSIGNATVQVGGEAIVDIRCSEDELRPRPCCKMTASSMDGRQLGTGLPEHDSWKLTVAPGEDAVLICSCMLALALRAAGVARDAAAA